DRVQRAGLLLPCGVEELPATPVGITQVGLDGLLRRGGDRGERLRDGDSAGPIVHRDRHQEGKCEGGWAGHRRSVESYRGPSHSAMRSPFALQVRSASRTQRAAMRYDFTPEQLAWRDEVRAFCAAHVTDALRVELRQAGNEGDGPLAKAFHRRLF